MKARAQIALCAAILAGAVLIDGDARRGVWDWITDAPPPAPLGMDSYGRISGPAVAVDGDTLDIGATRVRMKGIAAPEWNEPGGTEATDALRRFIGHKETHCYITGEKTFGREVGYCFVGTIDLGAVMTYEGYALACPRYSTRYVGPVAYPGPVQRVGYKLPDYCKVK